MLAMLYHKNIISSQPCDSLKKTSSIMNKTIKADREVKALVFDLVGVLFYVDKFTALQKLGIWNILSYFLRNFSNPYDDILNYLDKMRQEVPGEFQDRVKYKNYLLPQSMILWQRGNLSTQQTVEAIIAYLDNLDAEGHFTAKEDKEMMTRLLNMMINPELLLDCLKPDEAMIKFVECLKRDGTYKLYLLSNLDSEGYELFLKRYPEFIKLLDGTVFSGKTHFLKPFPEIFEYLLSTYNLTATECLFIDDQEENTSAAEELGFKTYLFQSAKKFINYFKSHY
jgi:HAD superfamily hydrolase (TIGR01509 family)